MFQHVFRGAGVAGGDVLLVISGTRTQEKNLLDQQQLRPAPVMTPINHCQSQKADLLIVLATF